MSPHSSTFSSWEDSNGKNNASVLRETKELQADSMAALARIRQRTAESREIGEATLDQMYDQSKTLRKSEQKTIELQSKLDKAHKQQDNFARRAFRFGTKRRAKKELKKEKKAEAAMAAATTSETPATFKRRGPRPKKVPEMNDTAQAHLDRNELFSDHLSRQSFQPKETQSNRAPQAPLSMQDQQELCDIEANDKILDREIDALGKDVSKLLVLSKVMNEVAEDQTTKLENIETNLEDTKTQTRLLNKRLGLLTKKKKKRR